MKVLGRALFWSPLVLLALYFVIALVGVDRCLDAGGTFDYGAAKCRYDQEYVPYTSFVLQSWWLIAAAVATSVVGLIVLGRAQKQ